MCAPLEPERLDGYRISFTSGIQEYTHTRPVPGESKCSKSKIMVSSDGLQNKMANFSKTALMILFKFQEVRSRDKVVGIATDCGLKGLG
jgi:hypothetical protein